METATQVEPSVSLPDGWEVAGALPVRVTMADPPLSQFLLLVGSNAAGFFLVVGVLWLIQRVAPRSGGETRSSKQTWAACVGSAFSS
jgi:hypothetical protein